MITERFLPSLPKAPQAASKSPSAMMGTSPSAGTSRALSQTKNLSPVVEPSAFGWTDGIYLGPKECLDICGLLDVPEKPTQTTHRWCKIWALQMRCGTCWKPYSLFFDDIVNVIMMEDFTYRLEYRRSRQAPRCREWRKLSDFVLQTEKW